MIGVVTMARRSIGIRGEKLPDFCEEVVVHGPGQMHRWFTVPALDVVRDQGGLRQRDVVQQSFHLRFGGLTFEQFVGNLAHQLVTWRTCLLYTSPSPRDS